MSISQKKAKQRNKLVTDLESRTAKEQLKGLGLFILRKREKEHCRMDIRL